METHESGKRFFSKDLLALLKENFVHDVDREMRREIWDKNNSTSLIRIAIQALEDFFLPDYPDEMDVRPDPHYKENKARQILERPLEFLKQLSSESRQISHTATIFVENDAISPEDARLLVNDALKTIGKSTESLEEIIQLRAMVKAAFQALQTVEIEDEVAQPPISADKLPSLNVPLELRKN